MRRTLVTLATVVAAFTLGARLARPSAPSGSRTPSRGALQGDVRVVRVVDGDTIIVRAGGRDVRVRYIGMDTPESVKPGVPVQCYAERASAENTRLVAGREVRLAGDADAYDRYGRRLAYVYREPDGLFVNAELVKLGYARVLTIPPNTAHETEFKRLARSARRAGRGLWSRC